MAKPKKAICKCGLGIQLVDDDWVHTGGESLCVRRYYLPAEPETYLFEDATATADRIERSVDRLDRLLDRLEAKYGEDGSDEEQRSG